MLRARHVLTWHPPIWMRPHWSDSVLEPWPRIPDRVKLDGRSQASVPTGSCTDPGLGPACSVLNALLLTLQLTHWRPWLDWAQLPCRSALRIPCPALAWSHPTLAFPTLILSP